MAAFSAKVSPLYSIKPMGVLQLGTRRSSKLNRVLAWTFVSTVVGPVMGLATSVLLARVLGVEARGHVAAIVAPALLVGGIASSGLGPASNYFTARTREPTTVSRRVLAISLPIAFGTGLAVAFLVPAFESVPNNQTRLAVMATLAGTVAVSLAEVGRGITFGSGDYTLANVERAGSPILRVGALGLPAVLGWLTIEVAVVATVSGYTIGGVALLGYFVLHKQTQGQTPPSSRAVIRYSAKVAPGRWADLVNERLDAVVLAAMSSATETGLYAIAVPIGSLPRLGAVAARQIVLAETTRSGDIAPAVRASRIASAFAVSFVAISSVFMPFLIPWVFGSEFRGAVVPTVLLLAAAMPIVPATMLAATLQALGKPGIVSASSVCASVVTAVGLILVVPLYGASGAAGVTLFSYVIYYFLLAQAGRSHLDTFRRDWLLPTRADIRFSRQALRGWLEARRTRK